ncbi:hypothetical protein ACQP3L_33600, partial [Escherichia coli]
MWTLSKNFRDTAVEPLIVKQLDYENDSPACQAAPRPHRRKADIDDFIKVCLFI